MATYASKGDRFEKNTINPNAINAVSLINANSGVGLSSFWSDCPLSAIKNDPGVGYGFEDDFADLGLHGTLTTIISGAGTGRYLVFGDTGDTILPDNAIGGGCILATDGTDDDCVSMATKQQPFQIVSTAGNLWFEARAKINSITTQEVGLALGLMGITAQTTSIPMVTNTGVLGNIDFLGFNKLTAYTTALNATYKNIGETEVAVSSGAGSLGTNYVKYGMSFKNGLFTFYVNGTPLVTYSTATVASAAFPNNVTLRPIVAVKGGESAVASVTLDWWKCYQLRA